MHPATLVAAQARLTANRLASPFTTASRQRRASHYFSRFNLTRVVMGLGY